MATVPMMETPAQQLKRLAQALYGEHWKAPTARAMGVNHKQIDRWLSYPDDRWDTSGQFLRGGGRGPAGPCALNADHPFLLWAEQQVRRGKFVPGKRPGWRLGRARKKRRALSPQ